MTLFNCVPVHRMASGFYPDPSVCTMVDGSYLAVSSSFEYFPGLGLHISCDGVHWTYVGAALTRPDQFPYEAMGNSQGIFAPTIRCYRGTYYLIATNVNKSTMILIADNPKGPWSQPLWIEDWPGIDPSLFFDDDGTVYICGNESGREEEAGIYLSRLDIHTGKILSARLRICSGITGSNPEGPHMYKREGMYYLVWAEGGTESGHMENIARSTSPWGPYEFYPGNPLITNRSTHLTLQAIGHCDFADFDSDRTLMVFHGTRNNDEYPAQGWIGREPYATWITWKNGWPDCSDQSYTCSFNGDGQALEERTDWVTPGIDSQHRYQVCLCGFGDQDGGRNNIYNAVIHAINQDFSLAAGPPLIGFRQTNPRFSWSATLNTIWQDLDRLQGDTSGNLLRAGLVLYANSHFYVELSASAPQGSRQGRNTRDIRLLVHQDGLISLVGSCLVSGHTPLNFTVKGNDRGFDFFAGDTLTGLKDLGFVPGRVLSFSHAGGFTGTVLGLFAHGKGTAEFKNISYTIE